MQETHQNTRDAITGPRARLLELSQARGVSLAALSELLGRNPSYLQQFIRKGSPRKLEEQDRATLARFLGIEEVELRETQENSYVKAPGRRETGDWREVPRLDLGASAGPGRVAGGEAAFDTFRFSRRWLEEQGLARAQLFAIRVEGDSMEPLLNDGDEILVDCSPRPFRDGIHVVRLGEAVMVKRVASAGPDRVVLLSQNFAYPPVEVAADEVTIIGRVVWKGGRV
ncbi:phage repressor protein C with HTH and peptisase S24 domain [Erythromicrobium ramosum]|uniref:Phage repressor protein C with HTH and peptisase S24 domain n=1 Tax=Erythrobacter ramosus TaxID=35811 RepID=A0A6I4UKA8_9SPHN|nr:S24 family peptidase [Erythrobacter ramosus]MBB3775561.1 phage repressor protein C with HTH and peptisase S24 domain [Erythrobacter ramosus]MXP39340.1 transcriptional regulator [Erythrobacter ramosus]